MDRNRCVEKKNRNKKAFVFAAGVLCMLSALAGIGSAVRAANGNGTGMVWVLDDEDYFKTHVPSIDRDLKIWQVVTVSDPENGPQYLNDESKTYDVDTKEMNLWTTEIEVSAQNWYEQNFQPEILAEKKRLPETNEYGWWEGLQITDNNIVIDGKSSYQIIIEDLKSTATYYRIGTGMGDLGEELFQYYQEWKDTQSGRNLSDKMILADGNEVGTYFNGFLQDFVREENLILYDPDEGISLEQASGALVDGIEMLTVSGLEIYQRVNSSTLIDLDALLYTAHNYTFEYSEALTESKLQAPVVSTLSGAPIGGTISKQEKLVLSPAENSPEGTVLQYALTDEADPQELSWTNYTEPFSPEGKTSLYVRSCPGEGDSGKTRSDSVHQELKYLEAAPAAPEASPEPGPVDKQSEISLNLSGGGMVLYTIGDQAPVLTTLSVVESQTLGLDTESQESAGPVLVEKAGIKYLKLNGVWYRSSDSGLTVYGDPISASGLISENGVSSLYAMAAVTGKEPGDFREYRYQVRLDTPMEDQVSTASGADLKGKLSSEETLLLTNLQPELGTLQYSYGDGGNWSQYKDGISLASRPASVKVKMTPLSQDGGYAESIELTLDLVYLETAENVSAAAQPAAGTYVDVGDRITLSTESGRTLVYVKASKIPVFTAVTAEERKSLNLDAQSAGSGISVVEIAGKSYLKLNDIWYLCSEPSVQTASQTADIVVDESIRKENMLGLYVGVVQTGKEMGNFVSYRYYYGMKNQTAVPTSTLPTSQDGVTEVNMGEAIGLLCTTTGSRIFYTTNGSVPTIDASESDLACKGSTKEYTGDPIIVSEDFATYGKSFTITAQAVTYAKYDGGVYRVNTDSEVVRFTYFVGDQAAVQPVTSVPATSSENPAEVEAGSTIQLYCETEGVKIYYTLDGSEPVYEEDTGEVGDGTMLYTSGIRVPEAGDNTMITVTAVAYKEGLAASEISRLVFRYPTAVSAPYATPAAGAVTENTEVVLKSTSEEAVIYYEIAYGDSVPADPTEESIVFDSANPIRITRKTTIKALAVSRGMSSSIAVFTYEVSAKLSAPVPSIDTGTTVPSGTRITLDADSGATVYYTLDGSDPKASDNSKVQVGNSVVLSGTAGSMVVLRTYASRTGYSDSESATYSYNISSYSGGIYADLESGSTVKNGDLVHLNTDVSDAVIYYTTDGSTPTENSTSGSTVTINGDPGENVIVMAIAVAEGTEKSITSATFTYTIMDRLAAPSASVPDGAVFTEESQVTLTAQAGRIYYTTDGTEPTTSSSLYKNPITVDESVTIKAMAVADDYEQSSVSTYTYGFADQVAAPTANYASGELEMGTTVTFSCATEGATIYYRTDGVEPDTDSVQDLEVYTGPIQVNRATNFKVIAVKDQMQDSRVLTVGYTVREPEAVLEEETEETQIVTETGGRLQSRRSFSDTESGPGFSGIVLRNAVYGVVVSSEEGVLPENVQLQVERTQVTETVENMVRQLISDNYGIVGSYEVKLLADGEEIQPDGEIEIGLPIPVDYENSLIRVVHVQEDGAVEAFETRRSGGVAYAVTDQLGVYSIAAPVEFREETAAFPWLPVAYTAAVALTGAGIFLLYRSRKMKREGGDQDE